LTPVSPGSLALPLEVAALDVVESSAGQQLVAAVSLAGQAFDLVPIDMTTQQVEGEECPILNLELGPIDLNLLGLGVATSAICLDVTAVEGQGLLGDLLCGLAGGLDLGGILDGIGDQLDDLIGQLEDLLDQVLGQTMTVTGLFGTIFEGEVVAQQEGDVCNILNLTLGPVDLEVPLLGVNVSLDNCEGGPITVDVTADPEGGLLGQLLCGLADGIDLDGLDLGGVIDRVDQLVDSLVDLADRLDDLGDTTDRIERLIGRLDRLIDRVDDLRDLDRFIDRIDRLVDRLDRLIDRGR
jgi:hypothetical protein